MTELETQLCEALKLVDAVRASSDWLNDLRDEEIEHICRAVLEVATPNVSGLSHTGVDRG